MLFLIKEHVTVQEYNRHLKQRLLDIDQEKFESGDYVKDETSMGLHRSKFRKALETFH